MINFRFHIASLIAVFLALALGVVMGSTVIDRAIVDGLRSRIDAAEKNSNQVRTENAQLRAERDRLRTYTDQSAPWSVDRQLTNQSVAVIAERGVNNDTVKVQTALLRQAGATVPGILWLEMPWNLGGDGKNSTALRAALGSASRNDNNLRAEAISALSRRLAQGSAAPVERDVLDALAKAGFVTLEGVGNGDVTAASFPGPGVRALVLGGPGSSITDQSVVIDLTRGLVAARTLTTVGEIDTDDSAANRGAWIAPIRSDKNLKAVVSTVDDVDLVQGRVASALALADFARGVVGAYGSGTGAQSAVPLMPVAG